MKRLFVTLLLAALLATTSTATAQLPVASEIIGREVTLSLRDAVLLALENNLNIQISRAAPAIAEEDLREARGVYDPIFGGSWTKADDDVPIASPVQDLAGGAPVEVISDESTTYLAGADGLLPFGLRYASFYSLERLESTSAFAAALVPRWTKRMRGATR